VSNPDRYGKNWRERGVIASVRAPKDNVVELTIEEMERQTREAEALRHVESPMYDVFTSPWADDEDARRRLLAQAGIEAPRPKERIEPWEVVEPERRETRRMIRSARRLTIADYEGEVRF
jgi:hypothetical protein